MVLSMVRIIVHSCSLMSHVHSIFSCSTFVMRLPSLHTAASKGRIATTSRSVRLDWCAHCFLIAVPYFYSLLLNLGWYTYSTWHSRQYEMFNVATGDRRRRQSAPGVPGRTVAKQITTSALLRPCDWIGRRLQGVIRSFQGAWGSLVLKQHGSFSFDCCFLLPEFPISSFG